MRPAQAVTRVMRAGGDRVVIRPVTVLFFLCTLLAAPVVIAVTHGPGPVDAMHQVSEILLHGHSHDEPDADESGLAHAASNHEHQTSMVLPHAAGPAQIAGGAFRRLSHESADGLPQPGPRRPPRRFPA